MKAKAPLAMIELCIMLLVFSLAAALCLRAFAWSGSVSRRTEAKDQALLHAQSAAEVLKSYHGDFSAASSFYGGIVNETKTQWVLSYNEDWQPSGTAYQITLTREERTLHFGSASVCVTDRDGEELISFLVGWQEEGSYA